MSISAVVYGVIFGLRLYMFDVCPSPQPPRSPPRLSGAGTCRRNHYTCGGKSNPVKTKALNIRLHCKNGFTFTHYKKNKNYFFVHEHIFSVFLLQNVIFHLMCYFPFLWNLLAISE